MEGTHTVQVQSASTSTSIDQYRRTAYNKLVDLNLKIQYLKTAKQWRERHTRRSFSDDPPLLPVELLH